MMTVDQLMMQSKNDLIKMAEMLGIELKPRMSKQHLATAIHTKETEARVSSKLMTPEQLIMEESRPPSDPQTEKKDVKPKSKFKNVFVTYYGPSNGLTHGPNGVGYKISFQRATPINLYKELWRTSNKFKEDKQLLSRVYKLFVDYYTKKAAEPGSDWKVTTKLMGVPIDTENRSSQTMYEIITGLLTESWEKVISQVKDWKQNDPAPPRPYVEMVTSLYYLELERDNRKTLMEFLKDELDEINRRDSRYRQTSD